MVKSRPTKHQMKALVELMSINPKLISGKFFANFTKQIAKAKWKDIANEFNLLLTAEKSWEKWKKVILS